MKLNESTQVNSINSEYIALIDPNGNPVRINRADLAEVIRLVMSEATKEQKGLASVDLFKRSMQYYLAEKYIHLCNLTVYYANCQFLIASGSPLGKLPLGMISCRKGYLPELINVQGANTTFRLYYRDVNETREVWGYESSSGGSLNLSVIDNHGGIIKLETNNEVPEGLIKV
ncbi:hypothetical protein [Bacteroides sp. 14(A)]|uniref:hypothetical protein n=1 Tax=Bacteroides sp. 14(A) TaxID=1163670 RepID=UPI0004942CFD|nr:hypothetical protein [Bacteroides sp. 14(A)]